MNTNEERADHNEQRFPTVDGCYRAALHMMDHGGLRHRNLQRYIDWTWPCIEWGQVRAEEYGTMSGGERLLTSAMVELVGGRDVVEAFDFDPATLTDIAIYLDDENFAVVIEAIRLRRQRRRVREAG